jgi:hypothetical protein
MKRKSKYAFVVSCNPGYGFGMLSTMGSQYFFKTDADWEIAYEGYTDEQRREISDLFPFNVNWTPIADLMIAVQDKRSHPSEPLNRFWLAYWLLAHRLLIEKKYDAVCVIQADQFVAINLDVYFKAAAAGIFISTEYAFTYINAEDLPFGDDKAIWDRGMCGIFDGVNFLSQRDADLAMDTVRFQAEDSFKGEANHSVIALNRSACRHCTKDRILRLDRHTWMFDSSWGTVPLHLHGDRIYNDRMIQINGWHGRWWQDGRKASELDRCSAEVRPVLENNINLVNAFMRRFCPKLQEVIGG